MSVAASASPYRAPTFHHANAAAPDDLAEVTVTWGDAVLSVTHLRGGEGFAWEGAEVVRAIEGGWAVAVPEGASGWLVRDGDAVEALAAGASCVVEAGARVCVALGEVGLRVTRTAALEALPRRRPAAGLAAGAAFLMALAVTGGALAADDDGDDGTIAQDDVAGRAWIAARLRPYAVHAPPSDAGRGVVAYVVSACFCAHRHVLIGPGDAWAPTWEEQPELPTFSSPAFEPGADARRAARIASVEAESDERRYSVRRVALRNLGQVARCGRIHAESARPGRIAMRFVSGEDGTVLAAHVASSTVASPALEECVSAALRRWLFAPKPGGVSAATVVYSIR
ncbi:MAG: AgmX/PglI C-terminal domain-containing protein [Polyangiales bacterium]